MAQRPADRPEWASSPPGGAVVTPPGPIRTGGWDPLVLPQAEHDNWFKQLVYLWIQWLIQTLDGLAGLLFVDDQPTPVGTPPAIGAGPSLSAGAFSAGVVYDGNLVTATDSPAIVPGASRRVFCDLSRDGVWTLINQALVDPTPAVTALSLRIYVFTTDGAGLIDAVADNRPDRSLLDGDRLAFVGETELGRSRDEFTAAARVPIQDSSGAPYVLLQTWESDGGLQGHVRLYSTSTGSAQRRLVLTEGARFVGGAGNPWAAEIDDPTRLDLLGGTLRSYRADVTAPASFLDAAWNNAETGGADRRLEVRGGIRLGLGVLSPMTTLLEFERDPAFVGTYRELARDPVAQVALYASDNVLGSGPGLAWVTNARWVEATGWVRTTAGQNSLMTIVARSGAIQWLQAPEGSAGADWPNTIAAASWIPAASVSAAGVLSAVSAFINGTVNAGTVVADDVVGNVSLTAPSIVGGSVTGNTVQANVSVQAPAIIGSTSVQAPAFLGVSRVEFGAGTPLGTPVANALYGGNTIKAWARLLTDGAGNITLVDGMNIQSPSPTLPTATTFQVLFDRDFAAADYAVIPYARQVSGTPVNVDVNPTSQVASGYTASLMASGGSVALDLTLTSYEITLVFLGFQ